MTDTGFPFTLHPQPRDARGSRVRFDCHACGHSETFVRLRFADMAHVLGTDHYWAECPEVRVQGTEEAWHVAHRVELAERHREVRS